MSAPLIHICGWPGSGKRTIARELAALIGGRVIDNHLMVDPASALFDRGTPEHGALRAELRRAIYDAALCLPPQIPLILTDALAESDADTELIVPTLEFAQRRGARFVPILLEITVEENLRRLTDATRQGSGKLTDGAVLEDLRARHSLLELPGAWVLNVTGCSPVAAAKKIALHLSTQAP